MSSLISRCRIHCLLAVLGTIFVSIPAEAAVPPPSRPIKRNTTTSPSAMRQTRSTSAKPLQRVAHAPRLKSVPVKKRTTSAPSQRPGYAKIIQVAGNSSIEEELRKLYIADGRPVPDFPVYNLPPEATQDASANSPQSTTQKTTAQAATQATPRQQQAAPSRPVTRQTVANQTSPQTSRPRTTTNTNRPANTSTGNPAQQVAQGQPAPKKKGAIKRFLGRFGFGKKNQNVGTNAPSGSTPKAQQSVAGNSNPSNRQTVQVGPNPNAVSQQEQIRLAKLAQARRELEIARKNLEAARKREQAEAAMRAAARTAAPQTAQAVAQPKPQVQTSRPQVAKQSRRTMNVDDALENAFDEMGEEEVLEDFGESLDLAEQSPPVQNRHQKIRPEVPTQPVAQPTPQVAATAPAKELDNTSDLELENALANQSQTEAEEFENMDELGEQLIEELELEENKLAGKPQKKKIEMPGLVNIAKLESGEVEEQQVVQNTAATPESSQNEEVVTETAPEEESPFLMADEEDATEQKEAEVANSDEAVTSQPSALADTQTEKPETETKQAAPQPELTPVDPAESPLLTQPAEQMIAKNQPRESSTLKFNEGVTQIPSDVPVVGLGHYCPVALRTKLKLVEGEAQFRATHDSKVYWFSTYEAKEYFMSHPEMYAPAHGGNDPVLLASFNIETEGSAVFSAWYQGKLYLFTNSKTKEAFRLNPDKYAR